MPDDDLTPAASEQRTWRVGDPCPSTLKQVRDANGTIWSRRADDRWTTPSPTGTAVAAWPPLLVSYGPVTLASEVRLAASEQPVSAWDLLGAAPNAEPPYRSSDRPAASGDTTEKAARVLAESDEDWLKQRGVNDFMAWEGLSEASREQYRSDARRLGAAGLLAGQDHARDKVVSDFCAERPQYITAIENSQNPHDYIRWQGHAEARRQLSERLAALAEPSDLSGRTRADRAADVAAGEPTEQAEPERTIHTHNDGSVTVTRPGGYMLHIGAEDDEAPR